MTDSSSKRADAAALAAMFIVALATNLGLALWTELEPIVRWIATIVAGITAAAVTFAVVSRKRRRE